METKSFKDLVVWQKAMLLVNEIYSISNQLPDVERFGLCSQITRCAVSIPSNIAEGYRRNGRKEYIQFCSIASGSSAELETQLLIIQSNYPKINLEKAQSLTTEVQKMLYALIMKLKA